MTFDVAAWVKQARKKAGMTQEEMAHSLGLSTKASISAYETGKQVPPLPLVFEIANLCNLPFIYHAANAPVGAQFGSGANISGNQNDFSVTHNVQKNLRSEEVRKPFAILADNSMSPVLPAGSEIWLEVVEEIQSQKIYYIEYGGEKMYRQLFRLPENQIRIKAYNPEFDEFIVDSDKIRVIGRVSEWHVKNQ